MVDSIRPMNQENLRRIHANHAGRLHKGHGAVAASSSIPSKYQTVVTDNSDSRGFLSKARRFQGRESENPGPGSYGVHSAPYESRTDSFSKRGFGDLASKSNRMSNARIAGGPGPGKYEHRSLLQSKVDYNRTVQSVFHQPIAVELKKHSLPGPGTYEPSIIRRVNNVTAAPAFKSLTKRQLLNLEEERAKPAPGQYEADDRALLPDPRAPLSSFRSKTIRNIIDVNHNPGPGAYRPNEGIEPVNKTIYPKKHYLCLSAPAMPLPPPTIAPGPGQYELRDFEGPEKHYMSTSNFVSSSSRWQSLPPNSENPGPGHYQPGLGNKESFIYNHSQRWL